MQLRNFLNRSASPRSAAAAVEFAILAPVLATLMLGMFELGRGVQVRQILTGAARKGCRTGILHLFGNSDITNDVTNVMQDNGFNSTKFNPPSIGSITITVTDPDGNTLSDALNAPSGSTISVQVAIPTTSVNWVSYMFMTRSMVESDLVVMMKQ
ncbi:MAG TPA: TadE/TadG family type IV pilus assembly protein [Gemmataceae bacterium]|jgi:Flp pilus assembly protein TadG